jgi:hypothetical protein
LSWTPASICAGRDTELQKGLSFRCLLQICCPFPLNLQDLLGKQGRKVAFRRPRVHSQVITCRHPLRPTLHSVTHCFERYGLMISLFYMWKINCERRGYTPPWCPYDGYPGLNKSPAYILYISRLVYCTYELWLCVVRTWVLDIEIRIFCATWSVFFRSYSTRISFPVRFFLLQRRRVCGLLTRPSAEVPRCLFTSREQSPRLPRLCAYKYLAVVGSDHIQTDSAWPTRRKIQHSS